MANFKKIFLTILALIMIILLHLNLMANWGTNPLVALSFLVDLIAVAIIVIPKMYESEKTIKNFRRAYYGFALLSLINTGFILNQGGHNWDRFFIDLVFKIVIIVLLSLSYKWKVFKKE